MIWTIDRLLLLLLQLAGTPAPVRQQAPPDSIVYSVSSGSRLVVRTGKSGLLGFAGHTHVIRARAVTGQLVYRPGTAGSSLRVSLPTDSLEVLTPPDTAEIRKVTEAMRGEVLHVDKYPRMSFAADSLSAKSGKMDFRLAVTMEGVTRPIAVTADVTVGADTIRARGTFTAKQTDFGIKPFRGGPAGTVKVADEVKFCFDLVAVRAGARAPAAQRSGDPGDGTTVPGCVEKTDSTRAPF
ncbi:MAG: YceI family protein [Gemmatimonadales bacterium]